MIECVTMPGVNGCLFSHALSPYSLRGTIPARAARTAAMVAPKIALKLRRSDCNHFHTFSNLRISANLRHIAGSVGVATAAGFAVNRLMA
jgi:hypothetical protein